MSITNYAELKTAVGNWLHRADLTSYLDDIVMLGEKRINREVRTPDMETAFSTAISSGVVAVPADFVEWKHAYVDGNPTCPLQVKSLGWIYTQYPNRASNSKPKYIARNGANFEFGPFPDSTYTVKGTYYARLEAVSSSWNALATANPDLYLFAALSEASAFVKNDARIQLWEAKYAMIRDQVNGEARAAEFSGSPLSVAVA